MIQDNINIEVLKQLQEYAQLYFDAILDTNNRNNKIKLRPGKYSAKDLTDRKKCQMQEYYCLPEDSMFNEIVTISIDNFECSFNYRDIFAILDRWERMMKAGKMKTWFEVGNVEVKSAKVYLYSGDDDNAVIEKRLKLQRLVGNWWVSTNTKRDTNFYYELNGVMFNTGKRVYSPDEIFSDNMLEWCLQYDDTKISELVLKMAVVSEYYRGITERVWAKPIDSLTATETPQISTVNAKVEDLSTESKTTTNTAFITPPTYSDVEGMVKTELAKK